MVGSRQWVMKWVRRAAVGGALGIASLGAMSPALAQCPGCAVLRVPLVCGSHAVLSAIASAAGERLSAFDLETGTLVELWQRPDGRSFTVLVHMADGTACVVASGTDWEAAPPAGNAGSEAHRETGS